MTQNEFLTVVRRVCAERAMMHQREAERWAPEYRGRTLVFKEEVYTIQKLIEDAFPQHGSAGAAPEGLGLEWLEAVAQAVVLLEWIREHDDECPGDNPVLLRKIDDVMPKLRLPPC
jgi:hypothetical protein